MNDVALRIIDNCFDLNIVNDELESDDGLETLVAISLFTDRRVTDEQLPIGHHSKRGWWGDMFSQVDQDQIGSRSWTLLPGKVITETLRLSEDYAREALNWMIDDGITDEINVTSYYNVDKYLISEIEIVRPDDIENDQFIALWDKQELRRSNAF